MKQRNNFAFDMADFDEHPNRTLWRAGRPRSLREDDGRIVLEVPFRPQRYDDGFDDIPNGDERLLDVYIEARGKTVLRVYVDPAETPPRESSDMLIPDGGGERRTLHGRKTTTGWTMVDDGNVVRATVRVVDHPTSHWSDQIQSPGESLELTLLPDGTTEVPLSAWDQFFPRQVESVPLALLQDGNEWFSLFGIHADANESFAGTGERFAEMNLSGRTLLLENTDALGVNNRRAYKNVPFVVSSRPYGLFIHTSHHVRLSLADVSTRAMQGLVEGGPLDLFVIGGGSVESIVFDYRSLTGFPPEVPVWTYGIWMSRMTYFSAEEVRTIASRLRDEGFPCDVLHLDTGWFAKDWVCEWTFSADRFPDPKGFMQEMLEKGFRITLWQTPNIGEGNRLFEEARKNRYIPPRSGQGGSVSASDFSAQAVGGQIDFTNPDAVAWYQEMITRLMDMGASAIKTDFGERITMDADYHGMSPQELHNLYGLLYQRAAFEATWKARGEAVIWARAGWAGCQRYPVHWGGDSASTWDGLAGSIRGGLHLGVSGFGFWSHDVPGFHGVPDFMNSTLDSELYVRWTQVGVFTSHFRYHGTSPREPYEYPDIADIVRAWWRLRYALIPYLVAQGKRVAQSGLPMLRALVFHHDDDPIAWSIDDEYYFGDDFLVAPILRPGGSRDVYLPEGEWVDLWDGIVTRGPVWLRNLTVPLARLPIYVRAGAVVPVYRVPVQSTAEMDLTRSEDLIFDPSYRGFGNSILGRATGAILR